MRAAPFEKSEGERGWQQGGNTRGRGTVQGAGTLGKPRGRGAAGRRRGRGAAGRRRGRGTAGSPEGAARREAQRARRGGKAQRVRRGGQAQGAGGDAQSAGAEKTPPAWGGWRRKAFRRAPCAAFAHPDTPLTRRSGAAGCEIPGWCGQRPGGWPARRRPTRWRPAACGAPPA